MLNDSTEVFEITKGSLEYILTIVSNSKSLELEVEEKNTGSLWKSEFTVKRYLLFFLDI
jgi:hypothetical protein